MKKVLAVVALTAALISCKEETSTKKADFKTGYIDTSILLKDYEKFKVENEKFKVKSEEMGRPIQAKAKQFEAEMASFRQAAQANGQAWAQQKAQELQQKEQYIVQERDQILGQIQQEGSKLQDTLVKQVKKFIKDYGKKEGYDYIFTTSDDAPTVIHAKDNYDLTKKVTTLLNEEYKATKPAAKK